MMKIKDLKKGDKLYELCYWENPYTRPKRQLITYNVKKIQRNRISLRGYTYTIGEKEFNVTIFPTKQEAYKNALKLTKREIAELQEDLKPFQKERIYLERKIKKGR